MMMNAPPPPPAPGKNIVISPQQGTPSTQDPATAPKPAPAAAQESDVGFLSDIRGKQVP